MQYLPLFKEDKPHFHTSGGQLAVGFKIYTYAAGTDMPVQVYSDPSGATPYTNPIVLDGRGEPSGQGIYADPSLSYKVVLKDPTGAVVWSMDGVKCAGVSGTSNEKEIFILHQYPSTGMAINNDTKKLMFEDPDQIEYLNKSDNFTIDRENSWVEGLNPNKRYSVSVNVFYSAYASQSGKPTVPARIQVSSTQSSPTNFYAMSAPTEVGVTGFVSYSYLVTGIEKILIYGHLLDQVQSGQVDYLYLYDLQIAEL